MACFPRSIMFIPVFHNQVCPLCSTVVQTNEIAIDISVSSQPFVMPFLGTIWTYTVDRISLLHLLFTVHNKPLLHRWWKTWICPVSTICQLSPECIAAAADASDSANWLKQQREFADLKCMTLFFLELCVSSTYCEQLSEWQNIALPFGITTNKINIYVLTNERKKNVFQVAGCVGGK